MGRAGATQVAAAREFGAATANVIIWQNQKSAGRAGKTLGPS